MCSTFRPYILAPGRAGISYGGPNMCRASSPQLHLRVQTLPSLNSSSLLPPPPGPEKVSVQSTRFHLTTLQVLPPSLLKTLPTKEGFTAFHLNRNGHFHLSQASPPSARNFLSIIESGVCCVGRTAPVRMYREDDVEQSSLLKRCSLLLTCDKDDDDFCGADNW